MKKKHRWTIQLFKDGQAVTSPEYLARISDRPPMPWFGNELFKCKHEISLTMYSWEEFEGTTPRISREDGAGNLIEEWDLLGIKVIARQWAYDDDQEVNEALITFEDTTYQAYDCAKCQGKGGYYAYPADDPTNSRLEGEHWYTCWECMGLGSLGVKGNL